MNVDAAYRRLATRPLAPQFERRELLTQVKEAVEQPDTVDQGLHPHMCVPAALQSFMAQTQPEDFIELVGDLASPDGEAETVSGDTLFRIEDALLDDGTGRNLMERLVQAAIFDGAERAAGSLRGSYSSHDHTVGDRPAQGLGTWQTTEMLKNLTGDDSWSKANPSIATLDKAADNGPVPVVVKTGPGRGHQMLLLEVDDGLVELRDPEGEYATAFPGAVLTERGHQTMTIEGFEKVFGKAYLRREQLPPEDRDPSTWMMGY